MWVQYPRLSWSHGTYLCFLLLPLCHPRHGVSPNCELSQALPSFLSCSWSGIWSQKQAKSLTQDSEWTRGNYNCGTASREGNKAHMRACTHTHNCLPLKLAKADPLSQEVSPQQEGPIVTPGYFDPFTSFKPPTQSPPSGSSPEPSLPQRRTKSLNKLTTQY